MKFFETYSCQKGTQWKHRKIPINCTENHEVLVRNKDASFCLLKICKNRTSKHTRTFQVLIKLYKSSCTSYHVVNCECGVNLSVKCMEGIKNLDVLLALILAINQVQFAKSSDLLHVHLAICIMHMRRFLLYNFFACLVANCHTIQRSLNSPEPEAKWLVFQLLLRRRYVHINFFLGQHHPFL